MNSSQHLIKIKDHSQGRIIHKVTILADSKAQANAAALRKVSKLLSVPLDKLEIV